MQPIKVGSTHELSIDSLANSGDGVGRLEGRVVFVPFSCPKDLLKVQITISKKSFLKATTVEVIKPSPLRVSPPCLYFTECGGCDWQHIDYSTQLLEKQRGLEQTLKRLGKLESSPVSEIIPSPKTLNYRNRIQLQYNKNGFCYSKKASHQTVPIKECLIADNLINEYLKKNSTNTGLQKTKLELAVVDGSVKTFKVDEKGNSKLGFRQVNDLQNQYLVDKTLKVIEEHGVQSVVDLYCGQGNWSRAIHDKHPHIHCLGIESNPVSVGKAQDHAKPNLEFVLGKVERLYSMVDEDKDLVIIDPPRSGCSPEVLAELSRKKPKFLIYISCHPATLARDLGQLCQNNWSLIEVQPVDMFPQTPHLECWSLLQSDS